MQQNIHFIGIGGIGMSALAMIYKSKGFKVTGSDMQSSDRIKELVENKIPVFIGEEKRSFNQKDIVVINPAIRESNIELISAKKSNCQVLMRSDLLKDELNNKHSFAVSGSHGKTTTSSILSHIFTVAQKSPTWIVGGILLNYNSNFKVGESDIIIAEADESDKSFLKYRPDVSIITNIDNDHLDFYKSEEEIDTAFCDFAGQSKKVLINLDDKRLTKALGPLGHILSFSKNIKEANLYLKDVQYESSATVLTVVWNKQIHKIETSLIGDYNIENALGAILCALDFGIEVSFVQSAMKSFKGTSRRLEILNGDNEFKIFDDYGHHPTAITNVIKTLRSVYKDKKLKVIFQPHRYTRTRDFWSEFLSCFIGTDELFLLDVYGAGEDPIEGIDSKILLASIKGVPYKEFITSIKAPLHKEENSIVLVLGAGNISAMARACINE